jgi:hypothetical protein
MAGNSRCQKLERRRLACFGVALKRELEREKNVKGKQVNIVYN